MKGRGLCDDDLRHIEARIRSNRAESLERYGEVQAMMVELTGVQQSMKEVIQHLEDRLEKMQWQVVKAVEMARQAQEAKEVETHKDQREELNRLNLTAMCEEAQRIFHEKASDFARAQLIMKEARTEAEEALQLRWSRPWVQEMDELGRKAVS
ncbi:unnamed protein product [Durusdinium trenchii]|uniref:Uncharacterized protein n=1 Tax=Durusdinium trenchii TaxID=1381693 RepID=A0ABP0KVY6_9DINO